jgi:DNA polymerase III delta prime subunit
MTRGKRKEGKVYTRLSRFNLALTYEQYLFLLERKRRCKELDERMTYKDLMVLWNMRQHHMATAVHRGIRQYDERIEAEGGVVERDRRQRVTSRRVAGRDERRSVGIRPVPTKIVRTVIRKYSQGGAVQRGYSDFIRDQYFED